MISKLLGAFSLIGCFGLFLFLGNKQNRNIEASAESNPILVDSKDVNISYNYTSTTNHSCTLSIVGQISLVSGDEQGGIVDLNAHYYTRLDSTISVNDNTTSTSYYFGVFSEISLNALPYDEVNNRVLFFGAQGLVYRSYDNGTNLDLGLMGYWNNTQSLYGVFAWNLTNIFVGDTSNLQFGLSWTEQHQISSTQYIFNAESFENNYMTGYQAGYTDGYQSGSQAGYQSGYEAGEIQGFSDGYDSGETAGYSIGYSVGFDEGVASQEQNIIDAYNNGYTTGYNEGFSTDSTVTTIFSGILQVALVPINFFLACFNFEILGINLSGFIKALFTVAITVIVIKTIFGGKGASE